MPPTARRVLDAGPCRLRPWRTEDLPALLRHADNPRVAANLRNLFPTPYTEADGRTWLTLATATEVGDLNWAIDVAGEAVGGIGLTPQGDVNAGTAEVGYWLGEPFWCRGLATAALATLTRHALGPLRYRRLFATVFEGNAASRRVLEKAGYRLEGVLRRSAVKHDRVFDQYLYAVTDEDVGGPG
jgi:RimJ/RimL family protein N-acetyltransferase